MRDPKRIKKILTLIEEIWIKYPDLRLMQLLLNAIGSKQLNDITKNYDIVIDHYNTEDDILFARLKDLYSEVDHDTDK